MLPATLERIARKNINLPLGGSEAQNPSKMALINEDVILELAQYLDILTSLSLAQSCSAAFRASQEYSFWSPHELHSSVGLAAFLPDDHVGPWKSYSGDEIRQAATKMRSFRSRWDSEQVSASHRVNVGRYTLLESIPGSRWLCAFQDGTNDASAVGIVDGKTGMSTIQDLHVGPIGPAYAAPPLVVYSLEPNRILIGGSGENDEEVWNFALFEIILSVGENDGDPYIETNATRIRLWETIPASPTASMIPEFLVIRSEPSDSPGWDLDIYHISSVRHWEWRAMTDKPNISLVDQWCILTTGHRTETLYIVAIHLPSLLCLPEATSQPPILPKGTALRIGEKNMGVREWIDIIPSGNITSRHQGTSEYTVILSQVSHRFTFDIWMEAIPGNLYGNVVWPGARRPLLTNRNLEDRVSSQFPRSDIGIPDPFMDGSTIPIWFAATQRDFEVLVIGFRLHNYIQILQMTNLYRSDHTRTLSWKAPPRRRTGASATVEMDYQGDPDEIRALPDWDIGTGMLLLRGPPLPGGLQQYQTCWF